MPPGKPPTISDVARAAGVSRTTASDALNGTGRVDASTRSRVRRTADDLGYRPNLRAKRLRTGRSQMIGFVSSMPAAVAAGPARLGFYMEVAAAAAEVALEQGYALILTPPAATAVPMDALDIDGAIVVEPVQDDPITAALDARGLPVVTLGEQLGSDRPHIDVHSDLATRVLLDHLHERGARRIALVVGDTDRHSYHAARAAYAGWCVEQGNDPIVATAEESSGADGGYRTAQRLLAEHPRIDGICAMVDAFAVGCVRAAHDGGRHIPADLLIATRYDGLLARTCDPPLTALNLHLARSASLAVELLLGQLRPDAAPATSVVTDTPTLVARASTAGLRG